MELTSLGLIYLGLLFIIFVLFIIFSLADSFSNIFYRGSTSNKEFNSYLTSIGEEFDGLALESLKVIIKDKKSNAVEKIVILVLIYPPLQVFYWTFLKTKLMLLILKAVIKLRNFWVLTIRRKYPNCDLDIPY